MVALLIHPPIMIQIILHISTVVGNFPGHMGQVENAEVLKPKYGNGSTENGSEKKSCLSVFSALLCGLRPCSQRVTPYLRCESRILGSRTAASIAIMIHVTASECGQIQTK